MDSIHQILECKWCLSQFVDPVTLPCGDSICEKHTEELRTSKWKCQLCHGLHRLTRDESYPTTKPLVAMLKSNISKLDFGPVFKRAKLEVEAVEEDHWELLHAIKEPKDFVDSFATKYTNQLDLAREETVDIVNKACDNMTAEITNFKKQSGECLRLEEPNMIKLARTVQSKMTLWKKSLNELVVNESLWNKIVEEAMSYQEHIGDRISEVLVIPDDLTQIKTLIQRNVWLKLSSRLQIPPINICDMRDDKCVLIRDVSKIAQAQSWETLWSTTMFTVKGFKFRLSIEFEMKDGETYLGAFIHSQSDHQKKTITMEWNYIIVGKYFQMIRQRDFKTSNEFNRVKNNWGHKPIITLSTIMAHPAYDAQDDMVRLEVVIDPKSVLVRKVATSQQ